MRTIRNEAERMFFDLATQKGWTVTKKGYPDFICYKGGLMMLVEVKKKGTHRLKYAQHRFMNEMKIRGLKCYKWSPNSVWNPW